MLLDYQHESMLKLSAISNPHTNEELMDRSNGDDDVLDIRAEL
jgi:hypothetical protein